MSRQLLQATRRLSNAPLRRSTVGAGAQLWCNRTFASTPTRREGTSGGFYNMAVAGLTEEQQEVRLCPCQIYHTHYLIRLSRTNANMPRNAYSSGLPLKHLPKETWLPKLMKLTRPINSQWKCGRNLARWGYWE